MSNDLEKITGTQRAAILMMSLGERDAAEVLKHMGPGEVQKVGTAMASLSSNISNATINHILAEFAQSVENQTALGIDSEEYVRKVMVAALGEDKAGTMISRILEGSSTKGLESLTWMEPAAVAGAISEEHPQIIAIVLSYVDSDRAAKILEHFPESSRADILMRIATLDSVQSSALEELNEILERQLSGSSGTKSSRAGGVQTVADILNSMDAEAGNAITEAITEADAEMATEIQDLMFIFENLMEVDDRGMQALLREIPSDKLILALKGADTDMQDKFFKNMSERAAEMMKDDLEAMGPVRLSEVEAAQKEILEIAQRMADAGDIALGAGGGDEFV